MTYSIASDLSYFVLQARRERGELGAGRLDSTNQRLYPLPSQVVQREAFIADRESVSDSFQGEGVGFDLTLGHYRPARRKA